MKVSQDRKFTQLLFYEGKHASHYIEKMVSTSNAKTVKGDSKYTPNALLLILSLTRIS